MAGSVPPGRSAAAVGRRRIRLSAGDLVGYVAPRRHKRQPIGRRDHLVMSMRRGPLTRGRDRGRTIVSALMRDAEAARLESGTSYAEIGRRLRLAPSQVRAILRDQSPELTIVRAAQVLEAVGLELSARAFPGGARARDAGQVALLGRLRNRVHPALGWSFEVPVVGLAVRGVIDRRAWDAGIDGPGVRVRIDAETHVGDTQAVLRRVSLKQRDGEETCVIL